MKKVITLILALMLMTTVAFAATEVTELVQIILDAGSLSIATDGNFVFNNVPVTGEAQTATAAAIPKFTLIDATGSNNGWNVQFHLGTLERIGGIDPGLQLMYEHPGSNYALVTIAGQPSNATDGPYLKVLSKQNFNTATKVVVANAGYGKGQYELQPGVGDWVVGNFTIPIPGETLAGTYQATLTASILSGP